MKVNSINILYRILLLLSLSFPKFAFAQQNSDSLELRKKIGVVELRKDLEMLKDSLDLRHPALFRFVSKTSFEKQFQLAKNRINKPMSRSDFYGIIAPIVAGIGDIHTNVELPDEYFGKMATAEKLFPFDVRVLAGKIYIISNNSNDPTIKVGSSIISVNKIPATELIRRMKSYFSSDGYDDLYKIKKLEQRFAFHFYVVYGQHDLFTIKIAEQLNSIGVEKKIPARPFSEIREARKQNKFRGVSSLFAIAPFLQLSIDKTRETALLTIKSFQNDVLEASGKKFKPFIDSAFNAIRESKINNLVIDIRNNGGGESENASYLFSWLSSKPFHFLYGMEANRKHAATDTASATFFGLNVQNSKPIPFPGNVHVLVDGLTVSSAAQFAILIRINKRGILIGEGLPALLLGGSGRGYSYFLLPDSKLLVMISHYRLYMTEPAVRKHDYQLAPDYRPGKTIEALIEGKDIDLEFSRKLIDSEMQKTK